MRPEYSCELMSDDHEPLSMYTEGGLHPVGLGDKFPYPFHSRLGLRVIHKLGHGKHSTLWLAHDAEGERYVALEIMTAGLETEAFRKILAIHELAASRTNESGERVTTTIETFSFIGPNGTHNCFVYHPPLGPDFAAPFWGSMHDVTIPQNVELHGDLSAEARRKFARKAAEELAWLHENGIGHGDFRPMNILNPLINLDNKTEKEVLELLGAPIEGKFHVWDKPHGPSHPKTIIRRTIPEYFPRSCLMDKVQLVGFQWSFDIDNPSENAPDLEMCEVAGYWAPEVIFENQVGAPADVWALACTLYEIRMNNRLFYAGYWDDVYEAVGLWCRVLGYIPEKWWAKYEEEGCSRGRCGEITMQDILRGGWNNGKSDLSEEEVEVFSDLLLKMLRYEKEDRITVAEVLKHPWMTRSFA